LTLYGPQDYMSAQLSFSHQATEIYSQLLHLSFEDWRAPNVLEGPLGVVSVLKILNKKLPMLHKVKFVRCFVDGEALLSIIRGVGDIPHHAKLEEIVLSYPSGITNDQCEELKQLVKTVKVHM
jgi:hypothetical protein